MEFNNKVGMSQNNFKIRCSAINSISAKTTSKTIYSVGGKEITTAKYNKIVDSVLLTGDISLIQHVDIRTETSVSGLSQGAETYCKNWIKEHTFGRSEYTETKYTNKGLETEEDALTVLCRVLKLGMIYKNEERKTDDFKTGEIDFKHDGIIYDNKSSFSFQSFPMFESKLDKVYHDQMQGYLDLWDFPRGLVCYTLVDTPLHLLKNELKWLDDDNKRQQKALNHLFTEKAFIEAKETLFPMADKIKFNPIEDKYRVKQFEVISDRDFINHIHITVKNCRNYIDNLLQVIG